MGKYYGVIRSGDELAHYGIKGMKWGVRRALQKNNMESLSNHYQRAVLKKHDLIERTNRKAQKSDAKSYAAGAAALLGTAALSGYAGKHSANHKSELYGLAGIAGLGGLGSLGKTAASAYRATKRGHKKAVEKYENFNSEMKSTFPRKTRKKIYKYWKRHPDAKWIHGE